LIKESHDFVESDSVRKYFSWPTPKHPKSIDDVTDPKESTFHFVYYDNVYTSFYKVSGAEHRRRRLWGREAPALSLENKFGQILKYLGTCEIIRALTLG